MPLNYQYIKARDLGDAWFQTLYRILDEGTVFTIDRGSFAGQKRLEFDFVVVEVEHPGARPLLPQIEEHYSIPNPVKDDYLDDYLPNYLMGHELKATESYTYGQRMTHYPTKLWYMDKYPMNEIVIKEFGLLESFGTIFEDKFLGNCINQIEALIWTYKNKGYRNNQMVLQVAQPDDMLLQDPPCLRHIDTRIQDGKLHFYPYLRSWDLWGGFPANLGGIQLLKEYVAAEIGVEDGEIIATSKGLHIYGYSFDLAKRLRMKADMKLKGE